MKTIAWDVDDTLNDLMRRWHRDWFLPRHRACRARYEDLSVNPAYGVLGLTKAAYLRSYDEFRLSGVYRRMPPLPEVLAWFRRNGGKYRHMAVTAVPLKAAHESAAWVFRHFGRWIRTFHVVPSPRPGERLPDYGRNKADFLRSVGGCHYFLDDSPDNVKVVRATGARCLTVPRPWNPEKRTYRELLASIS